MALIHSNIAKGTAPYPTSEEAGGVVVQVAEHVFDVDGVDGDILELGILPANHYLVDVHVVPSALAPTAVGIMTGEVGADTNPDGSARTVGPTLVASGQLNDAAYLLEPVGYDRSIGVVLGAAQAIGTSIKFQFLYAQ